MKRKESDRSQSARRQSYSHMRSIVDSEPWQRLAVHQIGSEESDIAFEGMYSVKGEEA